MPLYSTLVGISPSQTDIKECARLRADSFEAAQKISYANKLKALVKEVSGQKIVLAVSGVGLTIQFQNKPDFHKVTPGDCVTIQPGALRADQSGALAGGSFEITLR